MMVEAKIVLPQLGIPWSHKTSPELNFYCPYRGCSSSQLPVEGSCFFRASLWSIDRSVPRNHRSILALLLWHVADAVDSVRSITRYLMLSVKALIQVSVFQVCESTIVLDSIVDMYGDVIS